MSGKGNDQEVEFHEIEIQLFHEIEIAIFHEIEIAIFHEIEIAIFHEIEFVHDIKNLVMLGYVRLC
jgi:hypothetical protein